MTSVHGILFESYSGAAIYSTHNDDGGGMSLLYACVGMPLERNYASAGWAIANVLGGRAKPVYCQPIEERDADSKPIEGTAGCYALFGYTGLPDDLAGADGEWKEGARFPDSYGAWLDFGTQHLGQLANARECDATCPNCSDAGLVPCACRLSTTSAEL